MIKKIHISLALSIVMLSVYASCRTQSRTIAVIDQETQDTSVVAYEFKYVIENSDSIEWVLLDPMVDTNDSCLNILGGLGEVLSIHSDSITANKIEIVGALLSPYTLKEDSIVKDCTYMADMAVIFHKNDEQVIFSYSFYCDVCRFQKGDRYIDFNGEELRDDILSMTCLQFPNDRYFRRMNRKNKQP